MSDARYDDKIRELKAALQSEMDAHAATRTERDKWQRIAEEVSRKRDLALNDLGAAKADRDLYRKQLFDETTARVQAQATISTLQAALEAAKFPVCASMISLSDVDRHNAAIQAAIDAAKERTT